MGDAVWAKLRYCPYWPGVLVETPKCLKKPSNKFCVYFFGTENYGFVDLDSTHSYLEHKEKYVKKGRGKNFRSAVQQCDSFVVDPTSITIPEQKIEVAKEFGFNIKTEPKNDEDWYTTEVIERCRQCEDKDAYRLHIETCHRNEITELSEKIADLVKERNDLLIELKGYRKKEEYIVENIMAHKTTKSGHKFLVHWKGYDSSEDSWVPKENLSCPRILKKYLKDNNLR